MNKYKFKIGMKVKYNKELSQYLKSKQFDKNKIYIIESRHIINNDVCNTEHIYYKLHGVNLKVIFFESNLCRASNKVKKL